jgi:hypothetical protein
VPTIPANQHAESEALLVTLLFTPLAYNGHYFNEQLRGLLHGEKFLV